MRGIPDRLQGNVTVDVRTSKYARPKMESASAHIWDLSRQSRLAGVEVYSIVLPSDGSGLEVRTNDPAEARALIATSIAANGVEPADLRFTQGSPVRAVDRHDPAPPYQGGIPIRWDWEPINWDCTSAFGARNSTGNEFLLTAEHCYDAGDWVEDQGGDTIGAVQAENVLHDAALISTDATSEFWANDDYAFHFGAAEWSWDGDYVCQSGYTSVGVCTIQVTNELVQWVDDQNKTRRGVEGRTCAGCHTVAHGDSGGPVWHLRSDGVFESRGIVSAGHTVVEPDYSYEYILFTETPAALSALGVSLLTGP
ncbi:trypsin-like serine protease [Actinosynnema sp. NPDC059797]